MRRFIHNLMFGSFSFLTLTVCAADYVVTDPGPLNSQGFTGTVGNAIIQTTYSGPYYFADLYTILGTLNKDNPSTLAKDSTWQLTTSGTGGGWSATPVMTNVGPFTSLAIARQMFGAYFMKPGLQFKWEAVENAGVDNPGLDAHWTNVKFQFHEAGSYPLVSWAVDTSATINTASTSFLTKPVIYGPEGGLILQDLSPAPDGSSQLDASHLPVGNYYLFVGGGGTILDESAVLPGQDTGDLHVSINGTTLFNGILDPERLQIFEISVVPEPNSLVLMGSSVVGIFHFALRKRFELKTTR